MSYKRVNDYSSKPNSMSSRQVQPGNGHSKANSYGEFPNTDGDSVSVSLPLREKNRTLKPGKSEEQSKSHLALSDNSLLLECRAAYVSVVKGSSTNNPLTSKADLLLALQNTGRNPTQKSLAKSWTKQTEKITFEEFCEICEKEAVTSADDLMKAFKKIDINGDGFISHSELKKIMTTRGEKMSDEEVTRLIEEVDENKDGKLDYKEFSNMVLNTSLKCKETAYRRFQKKKTPKDSSDVERSCRRSLNGELNEDSNLSNNEKGSPYRSSSREGRTTSSARERKNSYTEKTDYKRSVPMSPRMSPRHSKGGKTKEDPRKDKFGSQTSLRSADSHNAESVETSRKAQSMEETLHSPKPRPRVSSSGRRVSQSVKDDSPKPAPRRMSRQEIVKPAVASLDLKLALPKRYEEWSKLSRRGMFYLEDTGCISSSQYTLTVSKPTSTFISITPSPYQSTAPLSTPLDMCVFVVRSKPDKSGNILVAFTERRDSTGVFGVRCDLEPGTYNLLTFTSGCGFPLTKSSKEPQKKLVRKKTNSTGEDKFTLTKEFKYVLTDIFNMVDTDMNGLLSKEEFNMYSIRSGEDAVGDSEWQVVADNAELKQGQLTCKGFIQLIELEAEDAAGDTDDLWLSLEMFGYDSSLIQTQAYPFTLEVGLESEVKATLSVQQSLATTKSRSLQTALREAYSSRGELLSADHRCGAAKTSGNDEEVKIYVYETDTIAAVLVDNRLPKRVTVRLDSTQSLNIRSNQSSLSDVFPLPPNTATAVYHFVPRDESKEWLVSCTELDLLVSK